MENSIDAIGIESVETKVKKPIINQPVDNLIILHRNGDDATKDRHCETQNIPLNSSNRSTPQPIFYDGLCKPEGQLDLAFEDSAPTQVGFVTIQDTYFAPIFQHMPYEIDSWFQVPCIPPSVPAMPPSSSFLHSQNHLSPISNTSSFAIAMPTSSHSIQGQPSTADDIFRPTEYQLALDYNRLSTHHEPCKTEAMKQAGASPAHYKNPEFQPILWSPTKEYRKRPA